LPTLVVVGSANFDLIVQSERLPRPGETVSGGNFRSAGGGKGANQAIAARRLGARVAFVGRVGDDGPGRELSDALQREGVDIAGLRVDATASTGVALILVDREGQNVISVAPGANAEVTAADVRASEGLIAAADAVVCQLEIPLEAARAALVQGHQRGLLTMFNPSPAQPVPDDMLRLAAWLILNEIEAAVLTGVGVRDAPTSREAGRILLDRGAGGVVVTLGDQGAELVSRNGVAGVAAAKVAAVDTTGAGDAFAGAFAVALARGLAPATALVYANAAAGLATTRLGAQPSLPTDAEVRRLLGRLDRSDD
jgi:ribokinase